VNVFRSENKGSFIPAVIEFVYLLDKFN
jgi:hypothetical protein